MTQTPPPSASPRPAGRDHRAIAVFVLTAAALLAADLAFKAWSFRTVAGSPVHIDPMRPDRPDLVIPDHDAVRVVPYVLSLKLWTNTGAVFGIGKGGQVFFIATSILASAFIFYTFARSEARARVMHIALAAILAGAMGNLYDRVRFHAVRDMLWLFPGVHLPFGLSWPGGGATDLYPWLFNIADAALVLGVGTLLILMWRTNPKPPLAG